MSYINIQSRIDTARALSRLQHIDKEKQKKGNLRAGSTGIMTEEGEVAGACHRTSLLRSKGMEIDPPTWDKYIMFELGYANEDEVLKQLQTTLEEGEIILREEEIPIQWNTGNGTKVTGRPDLVICQWGQDQTGIPVSWPESWKDDPKYKMYAGEAQGYLKPVLGLELKSVHSLWVAREVLFKQEPKLNNLVQAAHYMWKLNVPYKLFYKSYSQLGQGMAGNEWIVKQFPRPGEPGSEFVDYTISEKTGKYSIKHIKQFEIIYDLEFDKSGRLRYRKEGETGRWTPTIVTRQDIEKYFEYVSTMETEKKLGPRPSSINAAGDKLNYAVCKYCPLQETCNTYEKKGFDAWFSAVQDFSQVSKKDSDKTTSGKKDT
jgi:hypothetical protein